MAAEWEDAPATVGGWEDAPKTSGAGGWEDESSGLAAKPKTEGWADWAKRKYTEYTEPTEKLQQAAAGRVMGLGAGAGQAATSAGSAVADYAGAPGMAKYLSDMEQKFTKNAEAAKEISYPKGLTKEEAERESFLRIFENTNTYPF